MEASRRQSKEGRATWILFAPKVVMWESRASQGGVCISVPTGLSPSEETPLWHLKGPVTETLRILMDSRFASQSVLQVHPVGGTVVQWLGAGALKPHGRGSNPDGAPPTGCTTTPRAASYVAVPCLSFFICRIDVEQGPAPRDREERRPDHTALQ